MEQPPKFNLSSQSHDLDRSSLQTTYLWTREYSGGNVVASNAVYLENKPHEPTMFERLLHTVAHKVHRKSDNMDELKTIQWQEDDKSVRDGTCSFQVQYLGSVEVQQSKGVQVCENVIKMLKHAESRSSKKKDEQLAGHNWSTMQITSEAITVTDDDSQNVLVQDPVKSISFCSSHRQYEKCFAYIARMSPTEHRWICHAFSTITASGERLNHAVGCAFQACHENELYSGNNNAKEDEELIRSSGAGQVYHAEARKQTRITTDVSKLPDASIARPRPAVDNQKPGTESQRQVSIELNAM